MQRNHIKTIARVSYVAVSVALAAGSQMASAQTPIDGEIVVTAQKREQSAQSVGVSLTAVSAAQLRELNITSATQISRAVPGLTMDSGSGGGINALLAIRGVSQSDFSATQESPNSIYIDDVYLSSSMSAAFTLYDLQRVEALRGPQGTLFGRASNGGLVNFITQKPTKTFEGYAEVGYGSYNDAHFEGAFGGPISDSVRFRVSGRYQRHDGYYKNESAGSPDGFQGRSFGIRGQLEADLAPNLLARLSMTYNKDPRHVEGDYKITNYYLNSAGQPTILPASLDAYGTGAGNNIFGYRDPYGSPFKGAFNDGTLKKTFYSPTLLLNWTLGNTTITSLSNYTHFKLYYAEDCDGSPLLGCYSTYGTGLNQYSEELRANGTTGRLTYTAGLYYLQTHQSYFQTYEQGIYANTDFAYQTLNPVYQRLSSIAGFGQLEYQTSDKTKLTAGFRYTHDHKTFDSQFYYDQLGTAYGGTSDGVYSPPLLGYDFSKATVGKLATLDDNLYSGKVQFDYKPTSSILYYASVSRGVKGSGFNTNGGGTLTDMQTPFGPEHLYAFETGLKTEWFDRKLRVNLSAFYYDYHNFQAFSFLNLTSLVRNYNGEFHGGELEISARPFAGLTGNLGVAYLYAKLRNVQTAYDGIRDQDPTNAPKWTINGALQEAIPIDGNSLNLQWTFNYVSKRYASVDNNPLTAVKSAFVNNARITYELKHSDIEFAVFVNNIANVRKQTSGYDVLALGGYAERSYDPPRWFGGSIRKSF